jgi:hypothetical protein
MSPALIPSVKELASHLTELDARQMLQQAMRLKTTASVKRYMSQQLGRLAPNLKLLDTV